MKLAGVVSIGSYTPEDLAAKKRSLQTVLRPDTQLDMFAAESGVPYIESSFEFYLSEAAVARKVVEVAQMGYDAVIGTAFLDNGLDAARELVDIPVVGQPKSPCTWRQRWQTLSRSLPQQGICQSMCGRLPRCWELLIASSPCRH